jgi:hypothetical protein
MRHRPLRPLQPGPQVHLQGRPVFSLRQLKELPSDE